MLAHTDVCTRKHTCAYTHTHACARPRISSTCNTTEVIPVPLSCQQDGLSKARPQRKPKYTFTTLTFLNPKDVNNSPFSPMFAVTYPLPCQSAFKPVFSNPLLNQNWPLYTDDTQNKLCLALSCQNCARITYKLQGNLQDNLSHVREASQCPSKDGRSSQVVLELNVNGHQVQIETSLFA